MDKTSTAVRQSRGPFLILLICLLLAILPRPDRKPNPPPAATPDSAARHAGPAAIEEATP